MEDQTSLTKKLVMTIVQRKGVISSSYFLSQLLPNLGVITSVGPLIEELTAQNYLANEGPFDGTSGLIKNISITDIGRQFLIDNPVQDQRETYVKNFGESELLMLLLS